MQGTVAWQKRPAASAQAYRSSAAVVGDLAIVGTRGRAVEAFMIATGAQAWRHPMRGRVDASPVIVSVAADAADAARPAALVADAKGMLALLDVTTGEAVWEFDAGGGVSLPVQPWLRGEW